MRPLQTQLQAGKPVTQGVPTVRESVRSAFIAGPSSFDWPPMQVIAVFLIIMLLLAGFIAYKQFMRISSGRPAEWWRARRGKGMGVDELARRLDMPADELRRFQPSYSTAFVPKRVPGSGARELSVPDPATKYLQRRILRRLLARLRTHSAATGFEPGLSIVHNALPHAGQAVVLRLDIVDFFRSTRADRIDAYFRRIGWNAEAAALLTRLTTHEGGLPQGAPTSPRLSSLVNFGIDCAIERFAEDRQAIYTRYADDITLSFAVDKGPRVRGAVQRVGKILLSHGYRLHKRRKHCIRRPHQPQIVTGLIVNEKVQLPRRTRRWLRAVQHRLETRGVASISASELQGWLALQRMIEQQKADMPAIPPASEA